MSEQTKMDGDKVTEVGDGPEIGLLQTEYDNAWSQDTLADGRINRVENIRYARWLGQSLDGLKNTADLEPHGLSALPYEGAPDTRIMLADGIINNLVDFLYDAFFSARVKTAPTTARTLNAAQAAEWRAMISWLVNGPLHEALIDDVELAAQIMCMVGWSVLHPTWRNATQLRMKTLTMEDIMQIAAKVNPQTQSPAPVPTAVEGVGGGPDAVEPAPAVAPQSLLASAPEMILNPETEDAAVELFMHFFPGMDKREARRVIRELRENGESEFPVEEESSIGPEVGVLCPWYHFIMPIEATANARNARIMFVRQMLPVVMVKERARDEGWTDEIFVELLIASKGKSSKTPVNTLEDELDENMQLCEVVYAFSSREKDGVRGLYCTVMSPQVRPGEAGGRPAPGSYGKDWLLDLAHKKWPFIFQRMEVTGWRPNDSRGVCDVVNTAQVEMKQQRDATFIYSQLSVTPPLMRSGTQASKLPPQLGPFAMVNSPSGKPYERLDLTSGAQPEVAFKLAELVRKESEDYYGIPRADTPPQRWMLRQKRMVARWLGNWSEVLWQLSVLAYQNMGDEEIEQVLGRKPLLTADLLVHHKLVLWFDVRAGDGEWLDNMIGHIMQILTTDTGGTIDHSKLVQLMLSYLDPTLAEEVTMDQAGAKEKVLKDVRDEVNSMALGNKPMLVEKDPTAKMKMLFAAKVVKENPAFSTRLQPKVNGQDNPHHDPEFLSNFETYMKNLQHSYQETTLSKAQGRLGVSDVGQNG